MAIVHQSTLLPHCVWAGDLSLDYFNVEFGTNSPGPYPAGYEQSFHGLGLNHSTYSYLRQHNHLLIKPPGTSYNVPMEGNLLNTGPIINERTHEYMRWLDSDYFDNYTETDTGYVEFDDWYIELRLHNPIDSPIYTGGYGMEMVSSLGHPDESSNPPGDGYRARWKYDGIADTYVPAVEYLKIIGISPLLQQSDVQPASNGMTSEHFKFMKVERAAIGPEYIIDWNYFVAGNRPEEYDRPLADYMFGFSGVHQPGTWQSPPTEFNQRRVDVIIHDSNPMPEWNGYGYENNYAFSNGVPISGWVNTAVEQYAEDELNPSADENSENYGVDYSEELVTLSGTPENVSPNFGVFEGIEPTQTLLNPYDAYSGLDIDTSIFQNTNQGLLDSNQDGRIELGMFSFDDDNLAKDDFPNILSTPLQGLVKPNMVNNGNCQFVEKNLVVESDNTPSVIWPQGGWGYLSHLGIVDRPTAINQQYLDNFTAPDPQGVTGYGGYYSYIPLNRLAYLTTDEEGLIWNNSNNDTNNYWGIIDSATNSGKFLLAGLNPHNSILANQDIINDYIEEGILSELRDDLRWLEGFGTTLTSTFPYELPFIAFWMLSKEAFSNDRCLCFQNFQIWNASYLYSTTNANGAEDVNAGQHVFNWFFQDNTHTNSFIDYGGGYTTDNINELHQYRTLNQVQRIYDRFNNEAITPYSSLKIKFKMKTTHVLPPGNTIDDSDDFDTFETNPLDESLGYAPKVEIGILASQFNELPRAGHRSLPLGEVSGLNRDEFFQSPGGFNSQKYYNGNTFSDKNYSKFGGMGRFQNSIMDEWEDFEFVFNLSDDHMEDGFIYGVRYGGSFDEGANAGPVEILLNSQWNTGGYVEEGRGQIHLKRESNQTPDNSGNYSDFVAIIPPDGVTIPDNNPNGNEDGNTIPNFPNSVVVQHSDDTLVWMNTIASRLGNGDVGEATKTEINPKGDGETIATSVFLEAYLMYVGNLNMLPMDDDVDYNYNDDKRQMVVAYWDGERWSYDSFSGYLGSTTTQQQLYFEPDDTCFIIARLYADTLTDGITGIDQYIDNSVNYPRENIVSNLFLYLQSANNFNGRVLIDDIECSESFDFIPDVDVRKKISVGEYGLGNLTEYYDKDLQPNEYKDTTAPLEAQFYFYPQYPTDETFVERLPIYQDFKNGNFYLYDVDWGDGTPNEFTSEPKQIDENTSVYHTYESHGIFEVTGTMLRVKKNTSPDGSEPNIMGVAHNKRFKLRININPGTDEDFKYFGSDGFNFIPFKNTTPVVGGISNQSNYYKKTKRQLGFLPNGEKISIDFKYGGDKLKTELALLKMENQNIENLEVLPAYLESRYENVPIIPLQADSILSQELTFSDIVNFYNENFPQDILNEAFVETQNFMEDFAEIGGGAFIYEEGDLEDWFNGDIYDEQDQWLGQVHPVFTGLVGEKSIQFNYEIPTTNGEKIYNGITPIKEELGQGIGDCDLTSIKYYNKPKQMWEMLGFPKPEEEAPYIDTSPEYLATLPFPQYYEEFNILTTDDDPLNNLDPFNIGTSDMQEWARVGRPDITFFLGSLALDAGVPDNEYTYPDYLSEIQERSDLPFGNGAEQPHSNFYNPLTLTNNQLTNESPGNPASVRYWQNIIPKHYSIFDRQGIQEEPIVSIDPLSNQDWNGINETFGYNYYYPVLPKHGVDGRYTDEFPLSYNTVISSANDGEEPEIEPLGTTQTSDLLSPQEGFGANNVWRLLNETDDGFLYPNAGAPDFEIEIFDDYSLLQPGTYNSLGYYIVIGSEVMRVIDIGGLEPGQDFQSWTVARGLLNTTAYGHSPGETVTIWDTVPPGFSEEADEDIDNPEENTAGVDKIPFPDTSPIFDGGNEKDLLVNIINEKIEVDILNDKSGNSNYGFAIKDFSPKYDEETLMVKKTKQKNNINSSKENGAF